MPKQDVHADRAARLVLALRNQRDQLGEYPLTVAGLRDLADPAASDEELFKALAHKSQAGVLVVAAKKDLASPIALVEDVRTLCASPLLLEYALGKLASADKPLHPVAKIVTRVDRTLQPEFAQALDQHLAGSALPPGVGRRDVRGQVNLYLDRFPPPPLPRSPARQLADQMLADLEARRQQGQAFVTLAELAGTEVKPALVQKALVEEVFASATLVLPVSKTLTFVTLATERKTLLESERLQVELITARTTPKKPFVALDDLVNALPEPERAPFRDLLTNEIARNTLPTAIMARQEGDASVLCLRCHLPALQLLGEEVLGRLRQRRNSGTGYPTALVSLVPDTPAESLAKLAADKTFRSRVIQSIPGNIEAPLVLAGDEAILVNSPVLLDHAVGLLSTPEAPLHPLARIAARLDRPLRPAFESAVAQQIAEGRLPSTLAAHDVKGKPHLRLARHELPTPPPPPEQRLASQLLDLLSAARSNGTYPLPLARLIAQSGHEVTEKVVKSALAHETFRTQAIQAIPRDVESLVALASDTDQLASDPRLLGTTLRTARTNENQAIALTDLGKKLVPDLQASFTTRVEQQIKERGLPSDVGCLLIKTKPYLFLMSDLGAIAPIPEEPIPEESHPGPRPLDFTRMFDEAFHKLDQSGHNLVSLVRLREELPVERDTFDHELAELRRKGRYSLQEAEGRHGLSVEEREAGIEEYGQLLLYVSRRD